MLRAIRRANASGSPSAASKGCTVTASAPPTPAAKQATVVRSMFTHGSRCVVITDEVTACWRWPRASAARTAGLADPVPQPAGGPQLAMVVNWSAVGGVAELQLADRLVDAQTPPSVSARR